MELYYYAPNTCVYTGGIMVTRYIMYYEHVCTESGDVYYLPTIRSFK